MPYEFVELSSIFPEIYSSNPTPENETLIGVTNGGQIDLRISDGNTWYDVPNAQKSTIALFGVNYVGSTQPSASDNETWYDTSTNSVKVYYSGSFYTVA